MNMYEGVELWFHPFLTLVPGGGMWSLSCPNHFTTSPGKTALDVVKRKRPCPCQKSNPSHPACSWVTVPIELSQYLCIFIQTHLKPQHLHGNTKNKHNVYMRNAWFFKILHTISLVFCNTSVIHTNFTAVTLLTPIPKLLLT